MNLIGHDMNLNFLDFEQPIAELEAKIEELRRVGGEVDLNISDEIERLQAKSAELTSNIFFTLEPLAGDAARPPSATALPA